MVQVSPISHRLLGWERPCADGTAASERIHGSRLATAAGSQRKPLVVHRCHVLSARPPASHAVPVSRCWTWAAKSTHVQAPARLAQRCPFARCSPFSAKTSGPRNAERGTHPGKMTTSSKCSGARWVSHHHLPGSPGIKTAQPKVGDRGVLTLTSASGDSQHPTAEPASQMPNVDCDEPG